MMRSQSKQYRSSRVAHVVALAAVAVALGYSVSASAQEARPPSSLAVHLASINVSDLESAFWICDYTATVRRAGDDQITACTAVYDELKERKFGGDFDQLHQWWQRNRTSEYERLGSYDNRRQPR